MLAMSAAVCCIPTLSIGTIVACTMMGSAPIVYDLSSANGTAALPRMALVEHSVQSTRGDFKFGGGLDAGGKLDLLLLVCGHVADGVLSPDSSNSQHELGDGAGAYD